MKKLQELKDESRTMVFYESPYRLIKTLEQFIETFGEERICSVSRELSKIYEENKQGPLSEVLAHFKDKAVKGEIVIVLAGLNQS
jgi:16S rRNA (cytidine1402-2'-O)-methyltransferase